MLEAETSDEDDIVDDKVLGFGVECGSG